MCDQLLHEYFADWVEAYKLDAVRPITYRKYLVTQRRIAEIAPALKIRDLNKRTYQSILNDYAKTHEKTTVMDFHHHLKSVILDAVDEGILPSDPTRRAVVKGKKPNEKAPKFLSQFELQALLKVLNLTSEPNWDWLILISAKTGVRFSEALALTPNDFDIEKQKLRITKTWNYKSREGGFSETKNQSSKRTISIDPNLTAQVSGLLRGLPGETPIFVNGRVYSSTVNGRLEALCKKANIPTITLHCLRHTHASLLIYAGVSIASIANRLGHASTATTQDTYLHIIKELENRDNEKIVDHLACLDAGQTMA